MEIQRIPALSPAWLRMRPMELHLGHCFRASKMAGTSGDADASASVSWRRKLGLASVRRGLEEWGSQQKLACFQGLSTFWGWISGISMKQKRCPCFLFIFSMWQLPSGNLTSLWKKNTIYSGFPHEKWWIFP